MNFVCAEALVEGYKLMVAFVDEGSHQSLEVRSLDLTSVAAQDGHVTGDLLGDLSEADTGRKHRKAGQPHPR